MLIFAQHLLHTFEYFLVEDNQVKFPKLVSTHSHFHFVHLGTLDNFGRRRLRLQTERSNLIGPTDIVHEQYFFRHYQSGQ